MIKSYASSHVAALMIQDRFLNAIGQEVGQVLLKSCTFEIRSCTLLLSHLTIGF